MPNHALVTLREDAGLSQQDLADELNALAARRYGKHPQVTRKTIRRWERGEVVWAQPFYRRLLAEYFDVAADELGFRRPRRSRSPITAAAPASLELVGVPLDREPHVDRDQQQWRDIRAALGRRRRDLAVLAESLYRDYRLAGLDSTGAISTSAWIPDTPVPLEDTTLDLYLPVAEPAVTGAEPESAAIRPLASVDARYRCYHHAVRDLAAPRLFENRLCFRLSSLDWTQSAARMGTLTIRGGESPAVLLHHRDSGRVAGGGGMAHLLPAGIFQPSSVFPAAVAADFSIWRNIQREYAEELLGHDEYDGSGRPIKYSELEPFITMDQALAKGRIRVFYIGVILDALTLAGDILTVAVIHPQLYDELFANSHCAASGSASPAKPTTS